LQFIAFPAFTKEHAHIIAFPAFTKEHAHIFGPSSVQVKQWLTVLICPKW